MIEGFECTDPKYDGGIHPTFSVESAPVIRFCAGTNISQPVGEVVIIPESEFRAMNIAGAFWSMPGGWQHRKLDIPINPAHLNTQRD